MGEQEQTLPEAEEKPGTGIDRTVIRQLLALTPGERMQLVDNDARVLAQLNRVAAQLRRR
jgi:hypothetical protein